MDINIKQYTTVIIGLVVAVVLVAGLMVPVISSVVGGGGGDGGSTYVNEGTYYKSPTEGENHSIIITNSVEYESEERLADYTGTVTVSYDGATIITETYERKEMVSEIPEPVNIPILFGSATVEAQPGVMATQHYGFILCIMYTPYMDEYDYSIYGVGGNAKIISYYSVEVGGQIIQSRVVDESLVDESLEFTIEGDTFMSPEVGSTAVPGVQIHICDDGDMVYTENPVFSADSDVMMACYDEVYRYVNPADWDGYGLYASYKGELDEMNVSNMTYVSNSNLLGLVSLSDPVITTSDYNGALKLDSITMTALFEDDSERTFTTKGLIVPKEVQIDGAGSGSDISPTLASLISVIPLITVIGIVIGAVGYLRMKN